MGLSTHYPSTDHMVDLLVKVARLIEPVGHKPGSIELQISFFDLPKLMSLVSGLDVTAEAQGIPGILGYKLHILSTSASIDYDPRIIPFDFWETFCRVKREPPAEHLFRTRLKQLIHANGTGALVREQRQ
jgi:hypothetical protein